MSRRSRKNVGVIGLGIIGRRVAENLRKRGFYAFVWNRTPRPVPNFVGSITEVADLCRVIQLFVADDEALLSTIEQLSPSLHSHHIIIAHPTVAPETMQSAAAIVQGRGARFLDAPFTGSKGAAEKGELIYYVAGDRTAIEDARRILEASSKEIVEFGEVGEATVLKVATNMVTAATVQSAAEAFAIVAKSGIDPAKFDRALRSNSSHSGTLALKLPMMLSGDFAPHFSVKHMLKDLRIAGRIAQSFGLECGVSDATRDAQYHAADQGQADEDYCAIARKYFPDGVLPKPAEPEVETPAPEPALVETAVAENTAAAVPTELSAENPTVYPSVETEPPFELSPVTPDFVASPEPMAAGSSFEDTGLSVPSAPVSPEEMLPGLDATAAPAAEMSEATSAEMEIVPAPSSEEEVPEEKSRNFFSRLFARGTDY